MDQRSVFFNEWLRSLREQYKHVVRSNDKVTLPTLTAVMHNVGFGEDELNQLRLEATMHIDDVADDFVPDLNIAGAPETINPHPAECLCPQCIDIDAGAHDADGQPVALEPTEEAGHVYQAADMSHLEVEQESEPVTFEDSLARVSKSNDNSDIESPSEADDHADDSEIDPDAPQQISLF